MFSFIQVLIALVLVSVAYLWISWKRFERKLKWVPKVPGHPIFGNVMDFGKTTDTLRVLSSYVNQFNGVCTVDLITKKLIVITDLKLIEFLLTSTKILDKSSEYRFLERWLGDGILIARAVRWRKSRKIITPAFHFGILGQFVSTYESNVDIMVKLLEKEIGKHSFDIYEYVTMCTLDIIYETSMGLKINAQINRQSEYAYAVKEMCRITIARGFSAIKQINALYPLTTDYYKELKYVKFLHANTDSVIRARRKLLESSKSTEDVQTDEDLGLKKKLAFLDLMLQSKVDGEPLPDWYIKEEVNTLLFEGHDTTGTALSYALYSLAENPEVQAQAIEEQRNIFGSDINRPITFDDIQAMKYLELVIKETLRLYPPVPFYGRTSNVDIKYKGTLQDSDRLIKRYGKTIYFDLALQSNIITTDYDFVEYILGTQEVLAKSPEYEYLHNWLGTGLLTSEGLKWKKRRKMITPAFHFSFLEKFVEIFEQNLEILTLMLDNEVNKDSVDVYPFLNRFALDVICEAAMGVSVDAQKNKMSRYAKNVKEMCRIAMDRVFSATKKIDMLYALYPDFYIERKLVKELHSVTNSVIDSRRRELELNETNYSEEIDDVGGRKKKTFLDILLQSTIDGKPLSKEDIREEVDTFMFEGQDTISSAASFSLYLLSTHQEIQKRAAEEQKHIFEGDIYRKSTYSDLLEMKYLEMVIKETLRLYPPVPLLGRFTTQDVQYKGNIIPKDVNIVILSHSILRDPNYFENPEKFDPDRFENSDGTRPYSYIPFSAGPRNCIGQKFAMLELKSILSRILRHYELFPPTYEHKMVIIAEAVLKSKNGVRLKLVNRKW